MIWLPTQTGACLPRRVETHWPRFPAILAQGRRRPPSPHPDIHGLSLPLIQTIFATPCQTPYFDFPYVASVSFARLVFTGMGFLTASLSVSEGIGPLP